ELTSDPTPALAYLTRAATKADSIFIDIDCDVFGPAFFPALSHPLPFGLSPQLLLRCLDVIWGRNVRGIMLSEFDPGRDRDERSLTTLVWLVEFLLLKC